MHEAWVESHLSAAFSLEKVVSGLVLCCFLSFSLSECLSYHVYTCIELAQFYDVLYLVTMQE